MYRCSESENLQIRKSENLQIRKSKNLQILKPRNTICCGACLYRGWLLPELLGATSAIGCYDIARLAFSQGIVLFHAEADAAIILKTQCAVGDGE